MELVKHKSTGALFDVLERSASAVQLAPQGGGFVGSLPLDVFDRDYVPAKLPSVLTPFRLTGEWLEKSFPAYTNGARWNGWVMPWVSKDVVDQLINETGETDLRFDGETLVFLDQNEQEEVMIAPQRCVTTDGERDLYDLSLGWCWNEAEPDGS